MQLIELMTNSMSKSKRDSQGRINTIRSSVRPSMPEFKIPWKNCNFKINNLSVFYKESGAKLIEFYLLDKTLDGESLADKIVGHLEMEKDYGWPWYTIEWVGILPEYRGGIIAQLYTKIINKYNISLRSENQSRGAKKVWIKIIESGLVNVYFYNFEDASYSKAGIKNGKYAINFEEANEQLFEDVKYYRAQHTDLIAVKKDGELDRIAKKYIELKKLQPESSTKI